MRLISIGRTFIIGFSSLACFLATELPLQAQTVCDGSNAAGNLPKLPDGCQRELITASGNQRPTLFWAQKSAEDHWQDQVINKYGERFERWTYAACAKTECGPSSFVGFARCTYSGFPCATKAFVGTSLRRDEIREMQRLLAREGFAVKQDGLFGEKTHIALQKWQRSVKRPDDGLPTEDNLEALRKA